MPALERQRLLASLDPGNLQRLAHQALRSAGPVPFHEVQGLRQQQQPDQSQLQVRKRDQEEKQGGSELLAEKGRKNMS